MIDGVGGGGEWGMVGEVYQEISTSFLYCRYSRGAGGIVDVGVRFKVCEVFSLVAVHVV
jgi:hypothetical protein